LKIGDVFMEFFSRQISSFISREGDIIDFKKIRLLRCLPRTKGPCPD
jgi:hypothetical protein